MSTFSAGESVHHGRFGRGQVIVDQGESVVVRFAEGIEECLVGDLRQIDDLSARLTEGRQDPALPVVARTLARCIQSVNDSWGVFASSRIALLPHQLWVCKRVLAQWPTRWLVADDVGLGKTIEPGLILTPLLSSGRVRRLLILAPAGLVEQWQVRLREMFDIRVSRYVADADSETSDYWNTHDRVVASAQTLRLDRHGRWERLHEAAPWDLVLIDEAHHMNVDDGGGRTLAFQLVEQLQERKLVRSLVLFTGTPHRGKDYGFLSLLKLLRPDDFDPALPLEQQLAKLRGVMIRNNKQCVTDMAGKRLFTPVRTQRDTYTYSPEEALFYEKLTEFIASGKAYAANLGQRDQRKVVLTLITMQKLASSSVAAVRRALQRRLERLKDAEDKLTNAQADWERLKGLRSTDDLANLDEINQLEERLAERLQGVKLNPNEIPAIEELLEAAQAVSVETKVSCVLEIIKASFADRSVLLFTEYKATQALVMSALRRRFGDGCVAFINGDGYIEGVSNAAGEIETLRQDRHNAATQFNQADVRFLVSTEAAGEGIDLQENCSALIHVDLPWNPMRLHQRVGRLSRYGQKDPVDVVSVRNPDTVESRIWDLLDQKLERITLAFQGAMDDPEDMRQLVIGMASSRTFNRIFADAKSDLTDETLRRWFDTETATFGGEDAVETVRSLVGHVARFDFGHIGGEIPRVDLPDLMPFVKAMLTHRNRRPAQEDCRLKFATPEEWTKDDFAIADHYKLLFDRQLRQGQGEDVAGVGLRVLDCALRDGCALEEAAGVVRGLTAPLFVFVVRDRVTGASERPVVIGARWSAEETWTLLRDWEVIKALNPIADRPRSLTGTAKPTHLDSHSLLIEAREAVESSAKERFTFELPIVEDLAVLLPAL